MARPHVWSLTIPTGAETIALLWRRLWNGIFTIAGAGVPRLVVVTDRPRATGGRAIGPSTRSLTQFDIGHFWASCSQFRKRAILGGAMNLLWIAALTLLVAIEKLAPKGDVIAKALGALMIGAGVARLAFLSASRSGRCRPGGEAYSALAMECRLWRRLRSFPRRQCRRTLRLFVTFPPREIAKFRPAKAR
jgi:hypothetical protein